MTIVLERKPQAAAADTIHVVVADGEPRRRDALREVLAAGLGAVAVREAADGPALIDALAAGAPVDLVLLDPATAGIGGVSGLLWLRALHPGVPVVLMGGMVDPAVVRRCVAFGAAGVIPQDLDADAVRDVVRMVLGGEICTPVDADEAAAPDPAAADTMRRLASLTPQQLRVLMMVSDGLLNKQIAFALSVSEATVKAHVSAVLQKLGVDNRGQAVAAVSRIEGGCFGRRAAAR